MKQETKFTDTVKHCIREWCEAEKAFNDCPDRFSSARDIPAESRTIIDRYFEMNTHLYEIGEEWEETSFSDMDTHLLYCAMKTYVESCMMSEMCPDLNLSGQSGLSVEIMILKKASENVLKKISIKTG